jgi:hypothetical protein
MTEENRFWYGVLFAIMIIFSLLVMANSIEIRQKDCIKDSITTFFGYTLKSEDCYLSVMDLDKFLAGFLLFIISFVNLIPNIDKNDSHDKKHY